ncbi:MAG TPA: tetratricopeptide repeat protein [Dokdonella sp.]
MSEAVAVAAAEIRAAARAGDVDAQALYAQMFAEGRGVAADAGEAVYWYTLAGNSGHALAMNMVGRCHELGRGTPVNLELAAAWYRKAAQAGLDWGLYNYAQLLRRGQGVKPDRAQALALYRRAAALGHAKSMNLIGRYYDEGWEVERDPAVAIEWYRKAAIGGDFRGQTSYASILAAQGELVAAAQWLRRAATTATPAFLQRLAADLAQSPHAQLREIGPQLGTRAVESENGPGM